MVLKKFDFLSPNITLYYYNKKRHSSLIGGLLSIIMIVFCIYIIFHYSFIKVYPNGSSLYVFKNFDNEMNLTFDKSGLFHYLWIFNEFKVADNKNQSIIQIYNLKKGMVRIYMTYTYDKYDYNSSNLKDSDHWVYDTCSNYVIEEDLIYDYSYSSCIKYYYNSNDKKYYSINDYTNFKYPFVKYNLSDSEKIFFGIFVEKCENNTKINEILGECFPEEKINEYLNHFNRIFLSFVNSKIQINNYDNPVKLYSHKIYNNLYDHKNYFYIHDLAFIPFNFKSSKGIAYKKEYKSFMLDEDKSIKINNINNKKLLIAYLFHSKNYINEFRQKNDDILQFIEDIGGSIFLIYIILYGFNYFLNEKLTIRNFQMFLNNKDSDLIHRHINYDKNKFYSFKSNIYTNLSNDLNYKNQTYDSFKTTYLGNLTRNDLNNLSNINNFTNDENLNQNINNHNYTIKINRIENEVNNLGKKNDNLIVINNNSFINDNSNIKYFSNSSMSKNNSLKLVSKYNNNFENLKGYYKTFTYNKSSNESQSFSNIKTIIKKDNLDFVKIKKNPQTKNAEHIISKRNDSSDINSKQKIIETSSISLLNATNPNQNRIIISSSNNDIDNNTPQSNAEKMVGPNIFSKLNTKIQDSNIILPKPKFSFKRFNKQNLFNNIYPIKNDKKENRITDITLNNKERRKSHQQINYNDEKDIIEKNKFRKSKYRKASPFLKLPENKVDRHLSLFSKRSVINSSNSIIPNEKKPDLNSQNIRKSFIEQYKRNSPASPHSKRRKKRQSSEVESKNIKRNRIISNKNLISQDNEFAKMIQDDQLSVQKICNYICLYKKRSNNIYFLNNFRQKLLSEEYLYILHINMFIFKQRYGCKSYLEQLYLLDELYNDY